MVKNEAAARSAAMTILKHELVLVDYLNLTLEKLLRYQDEKKLALVSVEIALLGWRVYAAIAPRNHCFGLQMTTPEHWRQWRQLEFERADVPKIVRKLLKTYDVDPLCMPFGLLGYCNHPWNTRLKFIHGSSVRALPENSVRVYVTPLIPEQPRWFEVLMAAHDTQLAPYFCFPSSLGLDELSADPWLDFSRKELTFFGQLFFSNPGPSWAQGIGDSGNQIVRILELALLDYEATKTKLIKNELTPMLLYQEPVSFLLAHPSVHGSAANHKWLESNQVKLESHEIVVLRTIALLRLRLIRSLKSPIGFRKIRHFRNQLAVGDTKYMQENYPDFLIELDAWLFEGSTLFEVIT